MENELLKSGIYAIINKRLKMVYVGETQDCFLIRWVEHLKRMPDYMDNNARMKLYLAVDTQYLMLKEIDPNINDIKEYYKFEKQAQEFYKEKKWIVLSTSTYKEETEYTTRDARMDAKAKRYKGAVSHIVNTIGTRDDQAIAVSKLYNSLYKKVNKKFNTDVYARAKKGILNTLTVAELQFILLDLFPRYKVKRISIMLKKYRQTDREMDLFS